MVRPYVSAGSLIVTMISLQRTGKDTFIESQIWHIQISHWPKYLFRLKARVVQITITHRVRWPILYEGLIGFDLRGLIMPPHFPSIISKIESKIPGKDTIVHCKLHFQVVNPSSRPLWNWPGQRLTGKHDDIMYKLPYPGLDKWSSILFPHTSENRTSMWFRGESHLKVSGNCWSFISIGQVPKILMIQRFAVP